MHNFVLIGNPQSPRVDLLQQSLSALGLPPAKLIPYETLLAKQANLQTVDSVETYFRFDAPERNFATDRAFIAAGAEVIDQGAHQKISAEQAYALPEDKGRILCPRQWYLGWRSQLHAWTHALQGRILNHPDDIVKMFDKIQCQQILADAGIPIARSLTRQAPIHTYDQLKSRMDDASIERVFIKLAHGSSASGIVAYERRNFGGNAGSNTAERAMTTVERTLEDGELCFYNSRKVRQYRKPSDIADIINFLAKETIQVEAWMPKARLEGREFDLRVVVIGGKACHTVVRQGNSPMTNLHLGSDRRSLSDLPATLTPANWEAMQRTCEAAAACFPKTFYCGVDLLIAPNFKDHYILEVNAFGDLLNNITWNGKDTYTTEIEMLLKQQTPSLRHRA